MDARERGDAAESAGRDAYRAAASPPASRAIARSAAARFRSNRPAGPRRKSPPKRRAHARRDFRGCCAARAGGARCRGHGIRVVADRAENHARRAPERRTAAARRRCPRHARKRTPARSRCARRSRPRARLAGEEAHRLLRTRGGGGRAAGRAAARVRRCHQARALWCAARPDDRTHGRSGRHQSESARHRRRIQYGEKKTLAHFGLDAAQSPYTSFHAIAALAPAGKKSTDNTIAAPVPETPGRASPSACCFSTNPAAATASACAIN